MNTVKRINHETMRRLASAVSYRLDNWSVFKTGQTTLVF